MQPELPDDLANKLTQRLAEYDQWFLQEVQKGEDAADRGELLDHDAVVFAAAKAYALFHE